MDENQETVKTVAAGISEALRINGKGSSMKSMNSRNKKLMIIAAAVLLLLLQLGLLLYYGDKKAGFHEDEFYSYYSTNKTAGLFVNDREWLERESFFNDFVVLSGEEFRYDVVAMMQSWDVHPPVYYFLLHTVCSLFPGIFSKWLGIAVNLIAFVPCFVLLWYLSFSVVTAGVPESGKEKAKKRGIYLAFLTCMFWGFCPAVISGVMFIRMYQWLTLFVLLCACLHIRAMKRGKFGMEFLIPLALTVYLGFLTQYYYIIFHVFMGAGFCFLLLKRKKIKELFCYAITCAAGLGSAILSYPACMAHIFRGYRGTEAVDEFSNVSNTIERLKFFYGLLDEYVFHQTLSWWLLAICLLLVTAGYAKKKSIQSGAEGCRYMGAEAGLLLFSCAGYFFTISKTALLLGETSNRYQLPIYGMIIFLILYSFCAFRWKLTEKRENKKRTAAAAILLAGILLITDGAALKAKKVFFLYEEEGAVVEFVRENKDVPVIVFYNEASPANVWRLSNELMEVPEVYLASMGNPAPITDSRITSSEELLVYVADYEEKESCLEQLLQVNEKLSSYEEIVRKEIFTLYLLK